MKAIVTGAAGFIGSHVVELLLDKGFEVVALDDMSNGQFDNIALFRSNPNYIFHRVDVSEAGYYEFFVGADYVFHLAGLAEIIPSVENPVKYYQANTTGTLMVLEAARKAKVKKLVYAASSSCFGLASVPTDEEADIDVHYPYAATKFMGECMVRWWGLIYDLPVVSLRLFNVYGPRARNTNTYGAVLKTFISQKLNNRPFTVVGDGTQSRDFVYVKDVARAFLMAAESSIKNEVFNIGTGSPQTINYLAELIGGPDYPRVGLPWRPGEPMITQADISKVKDLLGWEPKVSFEEGIAEVMKNSDYWKDTVAWEKEDIERVTKPWFDALGNKS